MITDSRSFRDFTESESSLHP